MKNLPSNWKQTLKQCNIALTMRELEEFFQVANRYAEAEGQKALFKTEFVAGWYKFKANPCYKTAVAFLDGAPEYAPVIFEYFEGSCPGGRLYRFGTSTTETFSLGDYSLDMPTPSQCDLTELTDQEYQYFPCQFSNEIIYHAPPANFVGHTWNMMIGIVDGELYKLGASLELGDQRQAIDLIQSTFKYCETLLGTPTEEKQGLFVWDTADGKVILQTAFIMGTVSINIYVTSHTIRGKPIY